MNVLIDANVALDVILERQPWLGDSKGRASSGPQYQSCPPLNSLPYSPRPRAPDPDRPA